jgi:hypothetical protein
LSARLAQQIRVRLVGKDFAYASIVVDGWSVHGIRVFGGPEGIEWPATNDRHGRRWPVVTPPPGIRGQLEGEILTVAEQAIVLGRFE